MKMRKFACTLFSLVFLFSCSDENLPSGEPVLNMQKINNRIGVEDAINLVEDARALLEEEHPLESRSSRAVNSVSALLFSGAKSAEMKSGKYGDIGISDTLAYVFNFGDSSGFVIVSNDKRIENPLFAFAKKGSLVNGKTNNLGLMIFLERLEDYVLESIAKSGKSDELNAMKVSQMETINPDHLKVTVKTLIPVEWGQGKPFNNNLENKGCSPPNGSSNGRVWAGCVATATAQIMSYWKYPTTLGGISYDWTILNKYKHNVDFDASPTTTEMLTARAMVADLFQKIGAGVKMNYDNGCEVSLAATENALNFLMSKGFTLCGSAYMRDLDINFILSSLSDRRPLMTSGCLSSNKDCHAWVIDGLASTYSGGYPYIPKGFYIHNNWGWDGKDNGYYAAGVFNTSVGNFKSNIRVGLVFR
jgi:hypothetical protein